jgi:pimeloyl-ACP methyl ester carboxylesterase
VIDEVDERPLPDGLDQVTVPTLAVVGQKDSAPAKRAVPYLTSTIPGAEGRLVPRVGHQWNAENRELFSDMVQRWVESQTVHPALLPWPPAPSAAG